MFCYIIRHGKDDDTVRGGWSDAPLTACGCTETERLAEQLARIQNIKKIYSSDLKRAVQTAQIIDKQMNCGIEYISGFREVNNGRLAGMKNSEAELKYPDLYWRKMDWNENYPEGESPRDFFFRVKSAWKSFSKKIIADGEDVLLVTHGGVISVVLSIINGEKYSNTIQTKSLAQMQVLSLEYQNGKWSVKNH